jgi:hypothetical protein
MSDADPRSSRVFNGRDPRRFARRETDERRALSITTGVCVIYAVVTVEQGDLGRMAPVP